MPMPAKKLLPTSNLENIRKQAKGLLKAYQSGDSEAVQSIREHLPRLSGSSNSEILTGKVTLQEIQHVIACEYGFANWTKLKEIHMSANSSFDDISRLTDREIQVLMREVDQKDLVISLKGASDAIKEKVLGNMSERVRTFITEEMEFLGPMPSDEIEQVQQRIVQQLVQLADQGSVVWPPGPPKKKPKARPKMTKIERELIKRLRRDSQPTLDQMSYDHINALFTDLAEMARREGILTLGQFTDKMADSFLQEGIRLAVDGTEPDLIMDLLETWMESLLHEQKRKYQKVIEGVMAIQSGDNPRIVRRKLEVIY
jgi:hypothetical protein